MTKNGKRKLTLVCKLIGQQEWAIVSNPLYTEPHSEFFAARMLENFAVEYVEYVNCGVVYRVIRSAAMKIYPIEE